MVPELRFGKVILEKEGDIRELKLSEKGTNDSSPGFGKVILEK